MVALPGSLSHQLALDSGPARQVPPAQHLKQEDPSPSVLPPLPTPQRGGSAPAPLSPTAVDQGLTEASAAYKSGDHARTVQLCQAVSEGRRVADSCSTTAAAAGAVQLAARQAASLDPCATCASEALLPMPPVQLFAAGHRRPDLLLLLGAAHYQLGHYQVRPGGRVSARAEAGKAERQAAAAAAAAARAGSGRYVHPRAILCWLPVVVVAKKGHGMPGRSALGDQLGSCCAAVWGGV